MARNENDTRLLNEQFKFEKKKKKKQFNFETKNINFHLQVKSICARQSFKMAVLIQATHAPTQLETYTPAQIKNHIYRRFSRRCRIGLSYRTY